MLLGEKVGYITTFAMWFDGVVAMSRALYPLQRNAGMNREVVVRNCAVGLRFHGSD